MADYLGLVEETIRIQVTDDDIRDRARRAMDLAASVPDRSPDHVSGHDFSDRHLLLDELVALMGPMAAAEHGMQEVEHGVDEIEDGVHRVERFLGFRRHATTAEPPTTIERDANVPKPSRT